MPAAVENRQRVVRISRPRLRAAAVRALAAMGRPAGLVEIMVVDDDEIRALNGAFRGIRRRTDVLAFPLETPAAAGGLIGQIVVSAQTAARQAARLAVPCSLELELLVTHGVLHLIGYDDRDPVEADLMHRRERVILGHRGRRVPDRLWDGLLEGNTPGSRGTRVARGSRVTPPRAPETAHPRRPQARAPFP